MCKLHRRHAPGLAAPLVVLALLVPSRAPVVSEAEGSAAGGSRGGQPAAIELVGQLGGGSPSLAARDGIAYLAAGPSIQILDVTPLGRSAPLGRTAALTAPVRGVSLAGEAHVVAAAGDVGVSVYHAVDAEAPRLTATLDLTRAYGVDVRGGQAVVGRAGVGVSFVDLSMPEAPTALSHLSAASTAGPVALHPAAPVAYVVRDPGSSSGSTGALNDRRATTAPGQEGGVGVVDFSSPMSPTVVAALEGRATDVDVDGERLLVATDLGVDVYSIISATMPARLSTLPLDDVVAVALAGDQAAAISSRGAEAVLINLSNPAAPSVTAAIELPGSGADIALAGAHLVSAINDGTTVSDPMAWRGGAEVHDVSDPAAPRRTSTYRVPSGRTRDVAATGSTVLLLDGGDDALSGAVWSVDASIPAVPLPDGEADTRGVPHRVVARAPYGFVTTDAELLVVDSSRSGLLRVALRTPEFVLGDADIDLADPYLISVGGSEDTYRVLNLARPTEPREVALRLQPDTVRASAVSTDGDRTYLAGENGAVVLDTRVATEPRTLARMPGLGPARDVAAFGRTALAAKRLDGVGTVDATQVANIHAAGVLDLGPLLAAARARDHAFVLGEDGTLTLVSMSDPATPRAVADTMVPALPVGPSGPERVGMAAVGQLLYVAHPRDGLLVFRTTGVDLTIPTPVPPSDRAAHLPLVAQRADIGHTVTSLVERGLYAPLNANPGGFTVAGQHAYLGHHTQTRSWLAVVDITRPDEMRPVGQSEFGEGALLDVVKFGDYVAAAVGEHGIRLFHVPEPASPATLLDVPAERVVRALVVRDRLLYALDVGTTGPTVLRVFDVDQPAEPREVGNLVVSQERNGVALEVVGSRAYIAMPHRGLVVVDVATPANPRVIGDAALPGTRAVAAASADTGDPPSLLVVNQGTETVPGGLWLLSQGAAPRELGSLVSVDWPEVQGGRFVVSTGYTVVTALEDEMRVIDIWNPLAPRLRLEVKDIIEGLLTMEMHGRRLYVTEHREGLRVFDLVEQRR